MTTYTTRVARVCSRLNAAHAQYVLVGATPNVDVLTPAWNVRWEQAHLRARDFEVEGVVIPTACIADLIESKRTGRLQDAADIEVLEAIQRLRGDA